MEHTNEWLVIHPEEAENPKIHRIRRQNYIWPAMRGMVVWANNEQEAMEHAREVLLLEDPDFRMEQFEEEKWIIRELAPGEKVTALWMAGISECPWSKSPYKHGKKPKSKATAMF
jgi:hypothetical protein